MESERIQFAKNFNPTKEQLKEAEKNAIALSNSSLSAKELVQLFDSEDIDRIETGVKQLSDFSVKSWLLSALLLYTTIYSKGLWQKKNESWQEYVDNHKEQLGMDYKEISEKIAAARFFIVYNKELIEAGWTTDCGMTKLYRAYLALSLSGDLNATIQHMITDSFKDFRKWYLSFSPKSEIIKDKKVKKYKVSKGKFFIDKTEAVTISKEIPYKDKVKLKSYMEQIFNLMNTGKEIEIVEKKQD